MKQQLRERGRRVLAKVTPPPVGRAVGRTASRHTTMREDLTVAQRHIKRLRARIVVLEDEIQESRQLNRRLAELTDIVQELLIPISQRDEEKVREHLERYSGSL